MAAAPASVDVVIHLHGHSGQRAAMRIDRDKEPISGLDFADPRPPHETGRTAPTLLVLPRGDSNSNDSGQGYGFPALVAAGGLEKLIDEALTRFAARIGAASVARGRLILTAHSGGGSALIPILASGRDPDEVHVFDAFYTTKSSGTGMGLSICRSIIDAHGGKLWVEANRPRGAVFQFTLPGAEAEFTNPLRASPRI